MLKLFYKVHKWVGVGVGLLLLMWIVTGILLGGGEGRPREGSPPAWERATVSPAMAVALATSGDSALPEVRGVELDRLGARLVYRVRGPRGAVLVDAMANARLAITDTLAREVAGTLYPDRAVSAVDLLRAHDAGYPAGGLPAWRVTLADPARTQVHLGVRDGVIAISNKDLRLNGTLHGLHTFASLKAVGLARVPIRRLLFATGLVALVVVVTGYYLSLPRRWTRRRGD